MPGPYVGPRPFGRDEADRFFGRRRESWELTSRILNHRLVILHGRPGVGKTSLLQAGMLPTLGENMAHVLPIVSLGSSASPPTLPPGSGKSVNPLVLALLTAWAPGRDIEALRVPTISQFLQDLHARLCDRASELLPLVAVLDPADELLRDQPEAEPIREAFLDQLAQAMEVVDDLHLVLAMGSDVVGKLAHREFELSCGDSERYELHGLERDAALEAVTRPLEATHRSFAPTVAEELVDQLRTTVVTNDVGGSRTTVAPTVEPTSLQVACSALWRNLPEDTKVITTEHLEAYGDIEMATTEFCMRAVIEVAAREGAPAQKVWEWLETTFVTDLGTPATAYEGLLETGAMPNAVARAFEEHRILFTEERSGAVWFQLSYDGLIEPIRRGRRLSDGLAALAGPDTSPDTYLQIAESALRSGMLPIAEEYARGAVLANERDPTTLAEAKSFLGNLVFNQGRAETGTRAEQLYAAAERNFRHAAQLFETEQNSPAVGRVLGSLGRLLMERGRVADALGELRSALDRLRGDIGIRLDFARALRDAGQPQAALGEYTAVLTFAPDTVEALAGRGTITAEHGDPTAALRDLEAAIRLDPNLATRKDVVAARSRAHARRERRG